MKKKTKQTYEKPKLGVFRAPVTLMENYSRRPGNLSRENEEWKYDEKDPLWK